MNAEAIIRKLGPITVRALNREEVDADWVDRTADRLVEELEEAFGEDYGDPDDGFALSATARAAATKTLETWIRKTLKSATVWRCKQVAEKTYSTDEVLAMMREYNPDWFEALPS